MKAGIVIGLIVLGVIGSFIYFYLFSSTAGQDDLGYSLDSNDSTFRPSVSPGKIVIDDSESIDSNLAIGSDSGESPPKNWGVNYFVDWPIGMYLNSPADKKVLFFYADWCPTCRPIDAEFKARLPDIPAKVEIYRVNYNDEDTDEDEKALAEKYGVTYQHTFVQVDKEGNEITKWNGGGLDKLLSSIK